MRQVLESRPVRLGIGCFVALAAACIAIFALNLFTAPRPLAALLPTRTATRRPPPTITPVAYPPTPSLVSRDDFSVHTNFPKASGVNRGYQYEDAAYLLTPPLDPGYVWVLNQTFTNPDYRNLSLAATAAPAENSAKVEYGVLFWHGEDEQGQEHFIALTVTPGRSLVRLVAVEPVTTTAQTSSTKYTWTDIVPPRGSSAILIDGKPNELRVDVHPRRLLAYVNNELVIDTDDKIINDWRLRRDWDGKIGIIAANGNEPGDAARFTKFDVYADIKQP